MDKVVCLVCFGYLKMADRDMSVSLKCEHSFCKQCFTMYSQSCGDGVLCPWCEEEAKMEESKCGGVAMQLKCPKCEKEQPSDTFF